MVENCSLPCLAGGGRLRWFECSETKIQAAVAQLEISEQQAPGAFKALIAGLCCPGASIRADAQPGSWRLVREEVPELVRVPHPGRLRGSSGSPAQP